MSSSRSSSGLVVARSGGPGSSCSAPPRRGGESQCAGRPLGRRGGGAKSSGSGSAFALLDVRGRSRPRRAGFRARARRLHWWEPDVRRSIGCATVVRRRPRASRDFRGPRLFVVVLGHDGDLAGQFGDGDRVGVAAPTAASPADRRGPDGPVPGQQLATEIGRVLLWPSCGSVIVCPWPWPKPYADVSIKAVPSASLSSFRNIRPSRNAQGQMSTVSIASARMLASATNAPATICGARSALTPSSSARSAAVILEMKAMSCLNPAAVNVLFTRGPAPDGAAPVRRANDRNVFEVATVRSGAPASSTLAPASAISVASQSRSIATRRRPGGSSGSHSLVSRPAPSGSDNATSGSSSTPLDSSSEPPPMSMLMIRPATPAVPAAHREEGEPGLVDPAEHLECHAGLGAHPGEHVLGVLGIAHGRRGERHQLRAARTACDLGELVDVSTSLSAPLRVSLPDESIASASRSDALVELIGVGCPPRRASTTSR